MKQQQTSISNPKIAAQVQLAKHHISAYAESARELYLDALKRHHSWTKNVEAYPDILEQVERALNKVGLTVRDAGIPPHDQEFGLAITAIRKGGKFKFLTSSGSYNKQGQSTNHRQRETKARKLQQAIMDELTNGNHPICAWFVRVCVNQFSLENDRWNPQDPNTKSVLIILSLKRPQL